MIRNYLKIAWRNLQTNKLYSFINIAGLSIGMASCILIFLYVQDEKSYDRFHERADRIFRLTEVLHMPKEDNARAVSSPPMAPAILAAIPEVEKAIRVNYSGRILSYDQKKLFDTKIMYADSSIFDVFSFPAVAGNLSQALTHPYSIVLTETAAKKYFGDTPALGKIMKLSDSVNLTVTAILKDVPLNSHIKFDCLLSRVTIYELYNHEPEINWFDNNYYTYLLLRPGTNARQTEAKINEVILKAMFPDQKKSGLWYDLKLQPLTDIHLHSNLHSEMQANGDIMYVYVFMAAAIFILLVACCNFVNLSTSRSVSRGKEIGLRKVIGAHRSQLVVQFFSESFLFAFISGIIAIALVAWAMPFFNQLSGKSLSAGYLQNPVLLFTFAVIVFTVGLVAGIYPALLMSSFQPIKAIKGAIRHGWQDILLRKGLVIFQFTIAIVFITGMVLVYRQLQFIQDQKIGINKEQVVELSMHSQDASKAALMMDLLRKNASVVDASATGFSFKTALPSIAVLPEGSSQNEVSSQNTITADEHFLSVFQIPVVAGRDFSKDYPTDSSEGFIVNETAVRHFGWGTPKEAIGKGIEWGLGKKGKVVGVVRDFNFSSLHDRVKPLIIHILPDWNGYIALRIKPQHLASTLAQIENQWAQTMTNSPFEYSFVDQDFSNLYKSEEKMKAVLGWFTLLTIFVSCMGLFGLAAFTIQQRFKEIGIRKVLGASAGSITGLLSKDFLKLVFVAVCIGSPIAWYVINQWLQTFAYRVNISWWVFLVTGAIAMGIALATVSFQAIRAALANPVKSITTE